jgi:hypothetical protein
MNSHARCEGLVVGLIQGLKGRRECMTGARAGKDMSHMKQRRWITAINAKRPGAH